jgi:hypothetical protein
MQIRLVSQVLEKQRCHFVHYLGHTAEIAPPQDGAEPMQDEEAEKITLRTSKKQSEKTKIRSSRT